jgi:hypothetical protein
MRSSYKGLSHRGLQGIATQDKKGNMIALQRATLRKKLPLQCTAIFLWAELWVDADGTTPIPRQTQRVLLHQAHQHLLQRPIGDGQLWPGQPIRGVNVDLGDLVQLLSAVGEQVVKFSRVLEVCESLVVVQPVLIQHWYLHAVDDGWYHRVAVVHLVPVLVHMCFEPVAELFHSGDGVTLVLALFTNHVKRAEEDRAVDSLHGHY